MNHKTIVHALQTIDQIQSANRTNLKKCKICHFSWFFGKLKFPFFGSGFFSEIFMCAIFR
jgi:hypothetical protein